MATRFSRRKVLTLGVGAALVGPLLAACGGGAAPTAAPAGGAATKAPAAPAGGAATTAPAAPAAKPTDTTIQPKAAGGAAKPGATVVRFMKFAGAGWEQDQKFVDAFMQKNPNIEVKVEEIIYGEMYKKALALGATGTLADIYSGHNRWSPYLAYKGLGLELDPILKTSGAEIKFDDFFPSVIEDSRGLGADGKLYWLPTKVHPAGNAVVVFNMDLLDKAGVKLPSGPDLTYQQYEEIVRKAADPKNGVFGTVIQMAAPLYAAQALRSWSTNPTKSTDDSWLISRDGKKQQLDSPPVKAGYEWYRKLIADGLVPTSGEQQAMAGSGVDHFISGKMVSRAAEMTTPHTFIDKIKGRFKMEQRLWVKGPNGHRGSALSYNNHAIYSKTKVQAEAFKLLTDLTGPEIAFAVGYEGIGQPGARKTAWFNPKIWEKYPIMQEAAKWFESGVDPYPRPANLRAQEHQEIFSQEIQAYLDGKETWEQMFPHVQKRGQEIIDMPPP